MNTRRFLASFALICTSLGFVRAADLAGRWTTEFDTQIGVQKYVFEIRRDGDKLAGHAKFERSMGSGEVDLKEIKLEGANVSFTEPFAVEGNEMPITYAGTLEGDEMKLERHVGDFATERLVAKRASAAEEPKNAPR
ncbi:MAG TPA: hypothetical protein VL200_04270 [Lacunisphaera sp.]|jgi:hypothetical protein|nr:hypothetical protein [Lacunisphaera sp.]